MTCFCFRSFVSPHLHNTIKSHNRSITNYQRNNSPRMKTHSSYSQVISGPSSFNTLSTWRLPYTPYFKHAYQQHFTHNPALHPGSSASPSPTHNIFLQQAAQGMLRDEKRERHQKLRHPQGRILVALDRHTMCNEFSTIVRNWNPGQEAHQDWVREMLYPKIMADPLTPKLSEAPTSGSCVSQSRTPPPILGQYPLARMEFVGVAPHEPGKPPFDIVATYRSLLLSDPDLTMPVAAIESLVSLLQNTPSLSTISETLDLLATNADVLKRSIANPISLSAGTDLFQRYIINSLQRGGPSGAAGDFDAIRTHLLNNGRLFVARAREARRMIAQTARQFVKAGSTVLTNGGSRVVSAVLQAAAEAQIRDTGGPRFRVVYAIGAAYNSYLGDKSTAEGTATVSALRKLGVSVATISEAAVAYSMGQVDVVLVGAEGVVENGGIISRMGTYQMAVLAKAAGRPMYVVAESHKFVRTFPLGQEDIGVDQNVLDFTTKVAEKDGEETGLLTPKADLSSRRTVVDALTPGSEESGYFGKDVIQTSVKNADAVDYTPPSYISALISENGVLTPSAVSEELIKIWY